MLLALLRKMVRPLQDDDSVDPGERAFVQEVTLNRERGEAAYALRTGAVMSLGMTLTCLRAAPEIRWYAAAGTMTIAAVMGGMLLAERARRWDVRLLASAGLVASTAILIVLAWYCNLHLLNPTRARLAPAIFLVTVAGIVLIFPYGTLVAIVTSLAMVAGVSIAFLPQNMPLALICAVIFPVFAGIKMVIRLRFRHATALEYRARIALLPAVVVRRTGEAAAFAPRARDCVCISTDLKEYERLLGSDDLKGLAVYLRSVYTHTDQLLRQHFPRGNYCADWIAGELFIVVFGEDEALDAAGVGAALAFSRQLLVHEGRQMTSSIGLSSGTAFVGMMGPPSNLKATALGEVPGRARRLQQSAWVVTQHLAGGAAVIFGSDILGRLAPAAKDGIVGAVTLAEDQSLRDLADRMIHYARPLAPEAYDGAA